MALVVDRTSEFLECLKGDELFRRLRHGNEMFVVPRREKTGFEVDSEAIERRIEGWRIRLDGYRLRYLDFLPGGMADRERDEVDADAAAAVKLTSEEIESLKERAARMSDGVNKAHRLGMVVALVESLQVVDSLARDMRGARIRQAMEKKTKQSTSASQRKRFEELPPRSVPPQLADGMQHNPAMLQALEEENRSMHNELVTTFEEVQTVEKEMVQIAALNHMLASKVLEQTQEIGQLYDSAIQSVRNIERGNEEVKMLARDRVSIQLYVALFLILAALSLILIESIL